METEGAESDKKSNGALVGIVIIILVLIAGGYWFWQQNKDRFQKTELPAGVEADELGEINADGFLLEDDGIADLLPQDDLTGFDSLGDGI